MSCAVDLPRFDRHRRVHGEAVPKGLVIAIFPREPFGMERMLELQV